MRHARDINLSSMYLLHRRTAALRRQVMLELYLPALEGRADIEAVVRWVEEDSVGVQFGSLRA
ncbi:MAG: hypothetical protein M5U28_05565 [Sandaracinaceae bacterium]|nr:hypothetical protein [Sandaracinaceae bacterium]